jgi:betaine-aldehyde dehydrogenase
MEKEGRFVFRILPQRSWHERVRTMAQTLNVGMATDENSKYLTAKNWIDGVWVDSSKHTESFDPATGNHIGVYADASLADVQSAIASAVRAFQSAVWKESRKLRAKVLNQIADRFEAHREDLIQILSLENGKVRGEAAFEVDMIPSKFRFWASVVLTDYGRAMEVLQGRLSVVTRSAIGVAGIIAPFNSPLVLTVCSLAPALAAGVTTVIKLPGSTAQTNFLFSQVLAEAAEPPKGVINVFSESPGRGGSASGGARRGGCSGSAAGHYNGKPIDLGGHWN